MFSGLDPGLNDFVESFQALATLDGQRLERVGAGQPSGQHQLYESFISQVEIKPGRLLQPGVELPATVVGQPVDFLVRALGLAHNLISHPPVSAQPIEGRIHLPEIELGLGYQFVLIGRAQVVAMDRSVREQSQNGMLERQGEFLSFQVYLPWIYIPSIYVCQARTAPKALKSRICDRLGLIRL